MVFLYGSRSGIGKRGGIIMWKGEEITSLSR